MKVKKRLCPEKAAPTGCRLQKENEAFAVCGGRGEMSLTFAPFDTEMTQAFRQADALVIDLTPRGSACEAIFVRFAEGDGRTLEMNTMLFPGQKARAVFRLKWLDGSLLFPPLNPGTLKTCVSGQGLEKDRVVSMTVGFLPGRQDERRFDMTDIFLTDEEIEFPKAAETTVDALGQWKQKDWPGKLSSAAALKDFLQTEWKKEQPPLLGRNRFGGCTERQLEATGFFHVQKEDGRWYLADPDGCVFYSSGVFGVTPGEAGWIRGVEDQMDELPDPKGPFAPAYELAEENELYRRKFTGMFPKDTLLYAPATANLIRAFGEEWYGRWCEMTARRLRAWGINTLSMFSDPEFIRRSKMPYVIMLRGYPATKRMIYRDFPDVYAEEYEEGCRRFAAQLTAYRDDPLLIGYFLNNEPAWGFVEGISLAERVLENGQGTATLEALIAFLRERYADDLSALNRAWRLELSDFETLKKGLFRAAERSPEARRDLDDFTNQMIDRYAGLPAQYARKAAPRHLNLGMRFAHVNHPGMLRAARHFDVFSLNCYAADPTEALLAVQKALDMPVLIGEFHFGALDAGLPAPSLFHVKDQQARGEAYARYLTRAAAQPCSVGAHYFAYNDQPLWGRYDGENYQFGFVDVCNRPYAPFGEGVSRANEAIYRVKEGLLPPEGGETVRES